MTKSLNDHIAIDPNIADGKPHIAGSQIKIHHIIVWHKEMKIPLAKIAEDHNLTLGDVHAALACYYLNQETFDQYIKEDIKFAEAVRQKVLAENQKILEEIDQVYGNGGVDSEEKKLLDSSRRSSAKFVKGTW